MTETKPMIGVEFLYAGRTESVSLARLTQSMTEFLEVFGNAQFCGPDFARIIGQEEGKTRFENLLTATGFENQAEGFFKSLLTRIGEDKGYDLALNNISLPP